MKKTFKKTRRDSQRRATLQFFLKIAVIRQHRKQWQIKELVLMDHKL